MVSRFEALLRSYQEHCVSSSATLLHLHNTDALSVQEVSLLRTALEPSKTHVYMPCCITVLGFTVVGSRCQSCPAKLTISHHKSCSGRLVICMRRVCLRVTVKLVCPGLMPCGLAVY
jgi:hypothetical protein